MSYWLGYGIVLAGVTTYAYFMRMTPQDKADMLRKLGL